MQTYKGLDNVYALYRADGSLYGYYHEDKLLKELYSVPKRYVEMFNRKDAPEWGQCDTKDDIKRAEQYIKKRILDASDYVSKKIKAEYKPYKAKSRVNVLSKLTKKLLQEAPKKRRSLKTVFDILNVLFYEGVSPYKNDVSYLFNRNIIDFLILDMMDALREISGLTVTQALESSPELWKINE